MNERGSVELSAVFQRLQSLLLTASGVEGFLQRLTELAADAVEVPLSCGITARWDGHLVTVASSDQRAAALDESQYADGSGPCLHTLESGETTSISDLRSEQRWPGYVEVATGKGLRSSLSLPLVLDQATVAAMNLYSFAEADVFQARVRRRCEILAKLAVGSLRVVFDRAADQQVLVQLEQALASRTMIDQALGIVMGQQRCTADEAFALLRMRSQSSQRKLRDVATDLIDRVIGQPPQTGRQFDRR